ncbi:MAG: hypothetical protein AAF726_13880 [Planctomycetota bacterium]
MPDPRELKVGDRVRFVSLPDEWSEPGYHVDPESVALMRALIERGRPARVASIVDGFPSIEARLRNAAGTLDHHSWMIQESSGWRHHPPRPNG